MTQLDRPRFRQDLVAEPIDDSGTRFIDVMDPDSGNVFRFFEVEYSLACAMDGERDVPSIVQWAKEELGVVPSLSEVRTVIATLGELGYLDKADGVAQVAAKAQDELLRPGVVVGQPRVHAPALDVELGHAGPTTPVAAPRPTPAIDIELAPGVTAARPTRDAAKLDHDDIALGVPGRVDVSTDLSEQVGIDVEDVKEAVRASQVMKAVDVPPELAAVLSDEPAAKAPAPARAVPAPRNTPPPMPAVKPPPDVKQDAKVEAKAHAVEAKPVPAKVEAPAPAPTSAKAAERPVEKPAAKAPIATPVEAASKPPPAPAQTSRPLVVLLVIVVVAAVAFLVYRYVMKTTTTTAAVDPVTPHAQVKPPEPPARPPVESEKLGTIPESTEELRPASAGQIETLAPDGDVKAGSVIATLVGAKPLQTEIAALSRDIDKRIKVELEQAQKDQEAATAAGNKAGIASAAARVADRQKSLADKQGKQAAKQAELGKLELAAPTDGKLAAKAKVGARVTPGDTVFTLTRPAMRSATFAKADGASPASRVLLIAKADGKKLSCVVGAAEPAAIVITCPGDVAPDGTEVTYGGIDSTPPPATDTIEMTDENGSAAAIASPAPVRPATRHTPAKAPKPAAKAPVGSADAAPAPSAPTPDTTPPPAAPAGSAAP